MNRTSAFICTGLVVVLLAALPPLAVLAQAPAAQIVKERQESMKARGAAIRNLVRMTRGEAPWDAQAALRDATSIHAEGAKTRTLFPEGTGPDRADTAALPTIWQDRQGFEAEIRRLEETSGRLMKLAQSNDQEGFKAQVPVVGRVCASCHERYRKPQ